MRRIDVSAAAALEAALEGAVAALRAGQLVAFPTETVYGLGARADDPAAVDRLFAAKGRPDDKPIALLVPSAAAAASLAATWPPEAARLAEAFWPGPLTLVVEARQGLDARVRAGAPTIGLRVPAHPVALALLEAFGAPLATPSANRSGEPAPTDADGVESALSGAPEVALLLDGGRTVTQVASTVVDLVRPEPGKAYRILRQGALDEARIASVLTEAAAAAARETS